MHRVDNGDQGSLGMKRQCAEGLIVQSKWELSSHHQHHGDWKAERWPNREHLIHILLVTIS